MKRLEKLKRGRVRWLFSKTSLFVPDPLIKRGLVAE